MDYESLMCHASEIVAAIKEQGEARLTKREHFALTFMAAGITAAGEQGTSCWDAYADDAIAAADTLLAHLAKSKD